MEVFGKLLASVWKVFGKCFGKHLVSIATIWQASKRIWEASSSIWQALTKIGNLCPVFGKFLASVWQVSGKGIISKSEMLKVQLT